MNIIELTSQEIITLLKRKEFSFNQKTLIKDKTFQTDAVIITPLYNDDLESYSYKVIHLHEFAYWQDIVLVFLLPYRASEYWFQEWLFDANRQFLLNRLQSIKKTDITQYTSHPIAKFQTFLMPFELLNHKLIPYPFCFVTPHLQTLPPKFHRCSVSSMALIYDYQNLKETYKEVTTIQKELKKLFPQLSISLFAYPLSQQQLDEIFMTHTIVHFAGHINPKGLMINASNDYVPSHLVASQIKTKLLFLNGCQTSLFLLQEFVAKKFKNIIFFLEDQVDVMVDYDQIINFYIGLLMGYKLITVLSIIRNQHIRIYGWAHTTFHLG